MSLCTVMKQSDHELAPVCKLAFEAQLQAGYPATVTATDTVGFMYLHTFANILSAWATHCIVITKACV